MEQWLLIGAAVFLVCALVYAFWPVPRPPGPTPAPAPTFWPSPAPPPDPAELVFGVLDAQARRAKGAAFIRQYTDQEVRDFGRGMAEAYANPVPPPAWYSGQGPPGPAPAPPAVPN